jgi:Karyopherin (importin) alpha
VWALSNFCRGKPQPSLDLVQPAIYHLERIVTSKIKSALIDACWALSYLSDGDDDRIQAVMDTGVTKALVELLCHENASIVTPALRTLGNFVSGNTEQTQAVIDAGVLDCVMELLAHNKRNIRKETCWLLSNIAAGDHSQITGITRNPRLLRAVLNHVNNSEWEVRKEATWVASNIATGGNDMHVHSLVELGGIDALCSVIDVADPKILLVVLEAIDNILRVGQKCGRDYVGFVDECDGLDKIENLQEHVNNDIYEKAVHIIETYYGVDEEEDENLAPTIHGDTFSFGLTSAQKTLDMESEDAAPHQQNFQTFNFM